MSVRRYKIAGIKGCTPAGWHEYVSAHDYDAVAAELKETKLLLYRYASGLSGWRFALEDFVKNWEKHMPQEEVCLALERSR